MRSRAGVLAAALLLPVAAGLVGTLLAAFDAAEAAGPSLAPWRALLAWPGLAASLRLTLGVGTLATALSLATALALAVAARHPARRRAMQAAATPLLALPHAALAAGLAFLIAPSGWLARLASPWLTGWHTPPDVAIVHDRWGLALVAGLWVKETPFLLLATLAALGQAQAEASLRAAAAAGYAPWRAWALVVLPRVWPQLRLPLMAVVVYGLSSVDMAILLGPGTPPPLAVQVVRWLNAPDLSGRGVGSAAATLLAAICAAAWIVLRAIGPLIARASRPVAATGARGTADACADRAALSAGGLALALGTGGIVVAVLWAGATAWRFPESMPTGWSPARIGQRWLALGEPALATLALATASTALALLLAIAALRSGRRVPPWAWLPLLLPQPALLSGQLVLLVRAGLDASAVALVWAHLQFVLPYVLLVLAEPWRALDPRYARAAAALGAGPWRTLLRVQLPLLARPLAAAAAVGVAVSVSLYLPTLFAGGGRVATLATETVALASGPDRRAAGAAALALACVPLAAFALAFAVPAGRR